jgi:hypothetical protein
VPIEKFTVFVKYGRNQMTLKHSPFVRSNVVPFNSVLMGAVSHRLSHVHKAVSHMRGAGLRPSLDTGLDPHPCGDYTKIMIVKYIMYYPAEKNVNPRDEEKNSFYKVGKEALTQKT